MQELYTNHNNIHMYVNLYIQTILIMFISFRSLCNQPEFYLLPKQTINCSYNRIMFALTIDRNQFIRVHKI